MNKSVGEVIELFISKKNEVARSNENRIELDTEGVLEDKFYAKDVERSVLLTSRESYELVAKNNIEIAYGALGENILIDYNPYELNMGAQLKIGEVVVEITQYCTICNHLSKLDTTLPILLKDDRGIFVKVVKGGFIQKGDKLYLL
ncbi:MAG: MOSC domain-containing protein [uncultured Sulfurovum sp.]|uniref:MOSC domain-containing protein n=1 Tax=uncultured Sulfurovum sp. TaxID=269237 RepID=A0A6S6SL15_9BACT|nr:MAG: MOSC domain-containing protein [uncultured Sulfurovum sp.]